ncbi:MAG: hypothetical protein Q9210_004462, partial [Variospora velana]
MTGLDLDPALNLSRRSSIANAREDDWSASSPKQPHPDRLETTDNECRSPALTTTEPDAGPLEAGQMGKKQDRAARWFRAERAEVRKPKPISEWKLDMVFLQWKAEDDDETLRSASLTVDPPLYDNIKDKMRQVAVELCLVRSRIAYSMQNWREMESRSQQAYNLAADLPWEPFKAKCALPLGVALYQQGHWERAYENFHEALNTGRFYGPRSVIQKWINLVTERLPRERALSITPLGSVVEEKEEFPFPTRQDRKPESEGPPSSHHSLQVAECSTKETALPSTSEAHSSSAPLKQVTQAVVTGAIRYTGNAADGSTTNRVLDGPAAITVSTDPSPASFGSPRLYNPKDGPAPSPPMGAETPPLRPALFLPRTLAASSLSEVELPPPFAQESRKGDPGSEPGQGALLQDGPQEDDRQPLKPSSLLARKEASPPPDAQPTNNPLECSPPPSPSSNPSPLSALRHAQALKAARVEAEIARAIAIASPLVESARSASRFTSPRHSAPHSAPPYPPRPGWSTGHARPSPAPAAAGTGSAYGATRRPRNKKAISDGNFYGKRFEMRRPRRSGG